MPAPEGGKTAEVRDAGAPRHHQEPIPGIPTHTILRKNSSMFYTMRKFSLTLTEARY